MSSKKKYLLMNIGLSLASIFISIIVAELVLYHFFPQPTYAVRYSDWGFEHIPNISFKHTPESKEAISYIQYNSEGFRGPDEYQLSAPGDTLRIAILGDSYGEGAEVDYQFLHGTVLEELLNEYLANSDGRYRKAEVIKAGVYAYDSCQELRLFEQRVRKYEPKVVLVIYTGELQDNLDFCSWDGNGLQYLDLEYTPLRYYYRYAVGYLNAKSHLLTYLHRVYKYRLNANLHLPEQLNKTFAYTPPEGYDLLDEIREVEKPVNEYMNRVETTKELPDSEVHQLLFAIFSNFNESVQQYGGDFIVIFSHDAPENYALAHFLKEESIQFFDLHTYINDRRTQAAHFPIDGHWNEYGHSIVGHGFYEVVLYLLPHWE